jgi:hypothetical protein
MYSITPARDLVALCLGLSLMIPGIGEARPKVDTVVLNNGNAITGEVKNLDNGILRYSTDAMGTVSIEWDKVQSVDASYFFRVRTEDGQRYFGALGDTAIPGRIEIVHAEGTEDIAIEEVVAITPIESTLAERLDTTFSLGYSDFKASDSSTATMGFRVSYDDTLSSNVLDGRWIVNDNDDETNKSHRVEATRHRWRETSARNFFRSGATWESNDELAIEYRVGLNYGYGRYFIDSNRSKLSASLGLQGLTEEDKAGDTTESVEGMIVVEYSTWNFDSPELDLRSSVRFFPGITESGRYRADADIVLAWEIIDDLNFNITAFGNFDNETTEDGDDYDYGITTGIEWEL